MARRRWDDIIIVVAVVADGAIIRRERRHVLIAVAGMSSLHWFGSVAAAFHFCRLFG